MPFHSNRSSGSSRFSSRTGSTPNKKKKQKTIFGFKIGPPPKSDQEKRIERGATTIATTGSGRIITTPTQDNKSLIMSKATQQKTKDEYLSSTANLAKAKKKIGNLLNPPSAPANPSMGVRQMDPSGTKSVSVLEKSGPVYKGQTLTQYKPKGKTTTTTKVSQPQTPLFKSKLSVTNTKAGQDDKTAGIPKIKVPETPVSKPTLLRGGDKALKSGGQFGSLQERTFLKTSTKAGRSVANPSIGSQVAKTLSKVGSSVKQFVDPLGKGMPKLGGGSGLANMPSGMSTPVDNIKTSTFFDSKTKTPTKTKKPANIKMVTKNLPANYTVSSQKKSKPIPVDSASNMKQANTGVTSKIAGSNVLAQNIAKADAKMSASTYAKEGPEVSVFDVKKPKVPAELIRNLLKASTAELNAYMVPNVFKSYSKAEQKAIKAEFNKRNKNSKSGFPSLLARTVAGVL
jgi:hypothetical protein